MSEIFPYSPLSFLETCYLKAWTLSRALETFPWPMLMHLAKLLHFHFRFTVQSPDDPNIYLQKFLLGQSGTFASTVSVNHTVAGVLGGQLRCQRIPLVYLTWKHSYWPMFLTFPPCSGFGFLPCPFHTNRMEQETLTWPFQAPPALWLHQSNGCTLQMVNCYINASWQLRWVRVSLHACKDLLMPLWSCTISTYRRLLKIN